MDVEKSESEIFIFAAPDVKSLIDRVRKAARFLELAPDVDLADVAFTCARDYDRSVDAADPAPMVLALVAESVGDLRQRLAAAAERLESGAGRIRDRAGTYFFSDRPLGTVEGGKLAFVFPGVASFYPEMLRDLAIRFPVCRSAFDEFEEALAVTDSQFSPETFVFPPAPCYRHDAEVFTAGGYAQSLVAIMSANAALARLFAVAGVHPQGVVGHSGGDLNALAAAGMLGDAKHFRRADRMAFIRETYKVVHKVLAQSGLNECAMLALVSSRPESTEELLSTFNPDQVTSAFDFSPKVRTVAVATAVADAVKKALAVSGARVMHLSFDRPFNTAWCEKVLPIFSKFAARHVDARATLPIYSCRTASPMPEKVRKVREEAARQWVSPVRFRETILRMHEDGFRVFLEVGPRGLSSGFVDETLRGRDHYAIPSDGFHRVGSGIFLNALAQLAALGAPVRLGGLFKGRRRRLLDFSMPIAAEVRFDGEMPLKRGFPALAVVSGDVRLEGGVMSSSAASTPGARRRKVPVRAAAEERDRQLQRQLDFGILYPLTSTAGVLSDEPGIHHEIELELGLSKCPFLVDGALCCPNVSYSEPDMHGLVPLSFGAGVEIMAEVATALVPGRRLMAVDDLLSRRPVLIGGKTIRLTVCADRIAAGDSSQAAVKVRLSESTPDGERHGWTQNSAIEGTFLLGDAPQNVAFSCPPLAKPRNVHWSERDIYPGRLFSGPRLQCIREANVWSEGGLDYKVEVPQTAGAVTFSDYPAWAVDPLLLSAITDGFSLWRSHERLAGAFSFPFRLRHLTFGGQRLSAGQTLNCHLRLTGVTTRSQICDIVVSDGNGRLALELRGYEELIERLPKVYRELLLSPVSTYLTDELPPDIFTNAVPGLATAFIRDIPYPIFERNEELALKTLSQVVLHAVERREFADLSGSVGRRTEWLFGRLAAKEALRRFLYARNQARWTDADVQVWPDQYGKPRVMGTWQDDLAVQPDLAIAHTSQFVVAIVAPNARIGVDVESTSRSLSQEFINGVFSDTESGLATSASCGPSTFLRFWCAKEAVSKALGTGIRYPPRELKVVAFTAETGEVKVELDGQWLEPFKQFRSRPIAVSTAVLHGHVLAAAFIPASLFEPEEVVQYESSFQ